MAVARGAGGRVKPSLPIAADQTACGPDQPSGQPHFERQAVCSRRAARQAWPLSHQATLSQTGEFELGSRKAGGIKPIHSQAAPA